MAFPARPIAHRCDLSFAHSEIAVPPNPSIEGRATSGFASCRPPLMSNVRRHGAKHAAQMEERDEDAFDRGGVARRGPSGCRQQTSPADQELMKVRR
jgi:hypothetical protein